MSVGLLELYRAYVIHECARVESDYVFVNLWKPPIGAPMTARSVTELFERLQQRTGIRVHPDMLCRGGPAYTPPAAAARALPARERQLVAQLVPPAQEDQIVLALARCRGQRGVDAVVTAAVIQAARLIRLNATFLDLAMKGALALDVDEAGDLIFISLDAVVDPVAPADTEHGGQPRAK